ncbi:hypothetical protein [Mesoterricola sediminis]|uniref:GDYXXLXY domain-containing protein n=1 Tax=Mesoterricola sediminis TaxID=2927980 RepID=A0AA48HDT7_9BACT|nr:hypothetical protein [Mesoterricola sediminis]BDU76428.1 hypothetical protein METESE_13860 [Mesoterricola sediminis]
MRLAGRSLLLAGVHLALLLSLGGKLLVDRATRPRGWFRAAPVDPMLPVRGRYVALALEVPLRGAAPASALTPPRPGLFGSRSFPVRLEADGGIHAVAAPADSRGPDLHWATLPDAALALPEDRRYVRISEGMAFFFPATARDPSLRPAGEELWVEATLPRRGPLRPIRLGVKKDGELRPWKP